MCKRIVIIVNIILVLISLKLSLKAFKISAPNYLVYDLKRANLVMVKETNKHIYPASTTKFLTAMIAYNYLDENELYPVESYIYDLPKDSSTANLRLNEYYDLDGLIKALMINSANDAALVIACSVAKKINPKTDSCLSDFNLIMNEEARLLGAKNSHFTNPHGYHSYNHYINLYDMLAIMKNIDKYPKLKEISIKKNEVINAYNEQGEIIRELYLRSTNNLVYEDINPYKNYLRSSKTGFTDESKYSVVSLVEFNDERLLILIYNEDYAMQRLNSTNNIISEIKENYHVIKLDDYLDLTFDTKGSLFTKAVKLKLESLKQEYLIRKDSQLKYEISFDEQLIKKENDTLIIKEHLTKDRVVGKIKITFDNNEYETFLKVKEDYYLKDNLEIKILSVLIPIIIVMILAIIIIKKVASKGRYFQDHQF